MHTYSQVLVASSAEFQQFDSVLELGVGGECRYIKLHIRVGIEQGQRRFFKIHYSAITTPPPEANSLITNERQ
jgi:hypothetical protein